MNVRILPINCRGRVCQPENIHLEESYLLGGIKSEAGKEGEILLLDEIKPLVQHLMIDSRLVHRKRIRPLTTLP